MTFKVVSDSFKDGDYLDKDHILSADFGFGCAGGNRSPHLRWSGAPAGTKSFAVTLTKKVSWSRPPKTCSLGREPAACGR